MLHFIIGGVVYLCVAVAAAILQGPTKENETFNEIRLRLGVTTAAEKRKNNQDAKKLEKERKQTKEMEANQRRLELLKIQQAEIEGQSAKICADEEAEKKRQMVREEDTARAVEGEFGPHRWPTREEFQRALQVTQYDHNKLHFAIVGSAGSGKSSLINAFQNINGKSVGAAPTGTKETTVKIGRYQDPGNQPPRQWMVWFDVPGAGTQKTQNYDYFIKQGLFVFDLIILAIGDRFEEIDARILEDCARFKVPTFIVRPKADMHIMNSMKEYDEGYQSMGDNPELYIKCQDTFVNETQETVSEGLMRQNLPDQPVYIVSRGVLQQTYSEALKPSSLSGAFMEREGRIHENHLVKDLLTAAAQRRCDTSTDNQTPLNWFKDKCSTFKEHFSNRNDEQPSRDSDISEFLAAGQGSQTSQNTAPTVVGTQKQSIHKPIQEIRKVIYPLKPISSEELYEEMSRNDPELPNMLIEPPCMFTPWVAMLKFYRLAPIPRDIFVFGERLRVQEYKEKEKKKTKKNRESHVQTAETEGTASGGHKNTPVSSRGGAKFRGKKRGGRGGY